MREVTEVQRARLWCAVRLQPTPTVTAVTLSLKLAKMRAATGPSVSLACAPLFATAERGPFLFGRCKMLNRSTLHLCPFFFSYCVLDVGALMATPHPHPA